MYWRVEKLCRRDINAECSGASLAIGAEAYRSFKNRNQAINVAVKATQNVLASFLKREYTISCREITRCDFSSKLSFAKYMVSGRFLHCFNLAQNWAPEAVKSVYDGLSSQKSVSQKECLSCSTEVARKMVASDEEMVMVAGFAGGLGLSGDACGALSAAIWIKSLDWCREELKKSAMKNSKSKKVLDLFYETTDSKILCSEITGTEFKAMDNHTNYIKKGGCSELINKLSET